MLLKSENCFLKVRKHCGKKRKCWLPAYSPFPTTFSTGFSVEVVKSRDCVVELNNNSSHSSAFNSF